MCLLGSCLAMTSALKGHGGEKQRPPRTNNMARARETGSALAVDLQNVTVSCFVYLEYFHIRHPKWKLSPPSLELQVMGGGASAWADQSPNCWSACCPTLAVITQIVAAPWETLEHTRESPWRRQTEMHTSLLHQGLQALESSFICDD